MPLQSETTPSDAGREAVARRILALAQAHGVTIPQNADLRHILLALQISDPIPIPAFVVVADILFSILQANQSHHADGESAP